MKNRTVFTICAKNYLAQALTLKQSFSKNNPEIDFYIFLSDIADTENLPVDALTFLDEAWIPHWRNMAFKYNVIEFSTSIKPFCISKLFNEGYNEVIYLDPDIFVTDSLSEIFDMLKEKAIVISPHYCNVQVEYTGSITEEELLFVGIYNLGFVAIRNNDIGNTIVNWWKNRLFNKCFADKYDSLHVDQRWIDFLPAFFPNDVLITHHMGINPAIWNLHERELLHDKNDKYRIQNKITSEIYPLLFFHFSGFDPFNPKLLNRRHPKFNTDDFPSFKPLFKEYIECEYSNGYEFYSKLKYTFNSYNDGENVTPLQRRIYRCLEKQINDNNPFQYQSNFRVLLKNNKLLTGIKSNAFTTYTIEQRSQRGRFEKIIIKVFRFTKFLIGIRYYTSLIGILHENTRLEKQTFLIKAKSND